MMKPTTTVLPCNMVGEEGDGDVQHEVPDVEGDL